MYGKKASTSKHSDNCANDRADQTQCALLSTSGGEQRVEPYGSEKFQGWKIFEREESRLIDWAKKEGLFIENTSELVAGRIALTGATELKGM